MTMAMKMNMWYAQLSILYTVIREISAEVLHGNTGFLLNYFLVGLDVINTNSCRQLCITPEESQVPIFQNCIIKQATDAPKSYGRITNLRVGDSSVIFLVLGW